jgi:hypothetical protein
MFGELLFLISQVVFYELDMGVDIKGEFHGQADHVKKKRY